MINFGAIKALGAVVFAVACSLAVFAFGYETAERKLQTELQTQKAELQTQAREKEHESAEKLAEALAARDKALADAASLRRSAVRVRDRADSAAASLRAGSASPDPDGSKLARCRELLAEGANLVGAGGELAAEGAGLLTRVAADHDALSTQVQ